MKYDINEIRKRVKRLNKKPLTEVRAEIFNQLLDKIADPDPDSTKNPLDSIVEVLADHQTTILELVEMVKDLQQQVKELQRPKPSPEEVRAEKLRKLRGY